MTARKIGPSEWFRGERVSLRLLRTSDCTDAYVQWLNDPEVARFLETRWRPQTLESVKEFVEGMVVSADSYLFAIIENATERHVGNIKIGPIQMQHRYADVSYFIGDRSVWGQGYASEAISLLATIGFERLDLHRVQAGLYERNVGSGRALEKAGFRREGVMRKQLRGAESWEDHVWYGLLAEEWMGRRGG